MRLAIGDIYKVNLKMAYRAERLYFTFEICGEVFVNGDRFAIGLKHNVEPLCGAHVVLFDRNGRSEHDDLIWQAWEISRAKPKYQRCMDAVREG